MASLVRRVACKVKSRVSGNARGARNSGSEYAQGADAPVRQDLQQPDQLHATRVAGRLWNFASHCVPSVTQQDTPDRDVLGGEMPSQVTLEQDPCGGV